MALPLFSIHVHPKLHIRDVDLLFYTANSPLMRYSVFRCVNEKKHSKDAVLGLPGTRFTNIDLEYCAVRCWCCESWDGPTVGGQVAVMSRSCGVSCKQVNRAPTLFPVVTEFCSTTKVWIICIEMPQSI